MTEPKDLGLTPTQERGKRITTAFLLALIVGGLVMSYYTREYAVGAIFKVQDGHNINKPNMGAYH